ncbi:MAG: hybrid sensor histidine kinase/response regulator [Gallionellales bacterium 35-53-114]|jgi:two-component system chemotaxis sensor kinase CheA|nr:MAG: hybrid sensor histidine kinase/response regulator [Gallionellales bacterium 35-53-114]OYZ65480.1 MAG: hybrid sensor histidine kinase/response regulator [Gallionellales bacterium 24-53-125]OZB08386.1 MAG: hybrid sensor histidine kinase/response regulator [Gallionellales bacterium 39-52-133]HQS58330.1 hybrid sensor histidine kinase/response regulator [Gallionellaceae bacterium]HQS73885.1 hybrid sensor histidine kinase/response regulator [Gallionellaceae bacterium]
MANKNDELLKRLLVTFRIEADEHLNAMASGLLALEKIPSGNEAAAMIETVFREAHSLKGAARAVNFAPTEAMCQSLESVFAAMKSSQLQVTAALLDLLHRAIEILGTLLHSDLSGVSVIPPAAAALIRELERCANGAVAEISQATETEATSVNPVHLITPAASDASAATVRIPTAKLDVVMRQVEELLLPRLAARQRAIELHDAAAALSAWKKVRRQIQPMLRRIERSSARASSATSSHSRRKELQKVLEYLDGEHLFMSTLEERLMRLNKAAARDQHVLAMMTDSLLNDVKEMQLLPFSSLFGVLPRLARELAREQGKEVELVLQGGEIELDRRMLDEMKDPLIHLLRNAIDHGIESPAVRTAAGKPAQGKITLAVSQRDSGKIEVLMSDDGCGIDAERVRKAAKKSGIASAGAVDQFSEREVLALVFQSGISTSPIITDVSGRGLGLAIVREKVDRLAGSITIESHPGAGTAFHIVLPLSLATMRGVLVRVGTRPCVIPSAGVESVARVALQDIRTVENRQTIVLVGQVISLSDLGDVLELPRTAIRDAVSHAPVVVLSQNDVRIAFLVDEILGEQEILVKNLGTQLVRVRNVTGASVLGSGQVVPVLNVTDLLKSAVLHVTTPFADAVSEQRQAGTKRTVLVAEDSITSRSLLKNILESAGYAVTTAVDGMDAYTTLKTAQFDLVVSDVEMPRMDGFDLTARIRADKHLAEIPVVLVTALDSREHRERGIDAGANAYIVKSSFDQSNLLEVIGRLI